MYTDKSHSESDVPESVIVALNNGEHEAFEYIYLRYSDALTDFLAALLKSREEGIDIVQDVFTSLWLKRGIFDPRKGIKRYLFQLAKFHALDHLDKSKVRDKYNSFKSSHNLYEPGSDEIVTGKETALLIELVISRMPQRQREVFLLNRDEKLSYEEIADKLGISKNRVRNYISAALKELREMLASAHFFLF